MSLREIHWKSWRVPGHFGPWRRLSLRRLLQCKNGPLPCYSDGGSNFASSLRRQSLAGGGFGFKLQGCRGQIFSPCRPSDANF